MTAPVHVGDLAQRLAAELTTELALTTYRRRPVVVESAEDDDRYLHIVLADLTDSGTPITTRAARQSYPNPAISIMKSWRDKDQNRVEIGVHFPRVLGMDFAPYEPKRSEFAASLSMSRPVKTIAREIMRKVIDPFLPHWTKAKDAADRAIAHGVGRHEIAAKLADIVGIKTEADNLIDTLLKNGRRPDAETIATAIHSVGNRANGYFRDYKQSVELTVKCDADVCPEISIAANGLSEETAAKILRLIRAETDDTSGGSQ